MATDNDVLGIEGSGELVPALGKEWVITPPTKETRGAYEAWMVLDARQRLMKKKPYLPAAEFRKDWKMLTAAEMREDFAWGGELFFELVASNRGGLRMAYLLLRQRQPDVTEEIVKEIFAESGELLSWAVQSALHKSSPDFFSPPSPKPAAASGEAPAPATPASAASDPAATR